ncbi:MAG TPA: hypothetical protein VG603_06075, partial [Chitinophagales bacterium]|nr:hypothetical protein [Chitinophagales bacterium]
KNAKYLVRIYNQPPTPNAIYMPEGANAALNVGNIAYSPNATKLYYTQCEQKDKVSTRCDIYVSKYENYKWSTAQILPAPVNNHSFTNTHPCIAYDAQGNELLIFSSDRSGGYGGMDLWFCRVEKDGTYSDPQNMGAKINTRGNEVTPFFDFNKKKLYYSSDWLYGFGGYDIFETREQNGYWLEPVNLLQPVNTAQNDLYYSVAPDNSKAYITSNRVGSYFIEAATCCNDIYAYGSGKKIEPKLDTPAVAIKDTTPVTQLPPVAQVETTPAKPDEPVGPVPVPPAPATTTTDKLKKINQTLPVLYFDNDEPDARTLSDTTKLDYKQTYEAYASKIFEYEREFSKGMKGNAKAEAKNTVDSLFTNKVDKGFYDLIAFSSQLLDLLKSGNKIEVTIKGYCSPLNYSAYNMKLGYRRVASLENYLYHYQAGILLPYISSGQLVLKRISFGKETAPKDISDNLNDTRNSVYNPRAALERRVEVLSVELK